MNRMFPGLVVALVLVTSQSARAEEAPVATWTDAPEVAEMMANGGIEVCEVVALPLGLVPRLGTLLEIAAEWACLVPGALGADHVQRAHGDRNGSAWQATVALGAGKLWRDATRIAAAAVLIAGAGGALVTVAITAAALTFTVLPVAVFALPVLAAGILTTAAGIYVGIREVRKSVQGWIFSTVYEALTARFPSRQEQVRAQRVALVRAPFNVFERWWYLAALSAGARGDASGWKWVPVVGPLVKAHANADARQRLLRRVAAEELREERHNWGLVDGTIRLLGWSEGLLGAASHLALLGSALTIAAGALSALAMIPLGATQMPLLKGDMTGWMTAAGRAAPVAVLTMVLGGVALGLAVTGVAAIIGREVPKALEPVVVPIAYGLIPDGAWFPAKDARVEKVAE